MISVITPSVRPDGLYLVEKALKRQTFRDFEWIVQGREGEKPDDLVWTLNRDYNHAIRKAKGELVVSWQDWTYAKPDALERFWNHYLAEPKTLVTGVGNKYQDDTWSVVIWQDPRERSDQGSYYPCYWMDVEWNFASIPREAIYAVGGFLESFDQYFGLDAYNVNERINEVGGYDFKIDQSIRSYSLTHGRPDKWDELNWQTNNRYTEIKNKLRLEGQWPVAKYLELSDKSNK